MAEPCADKPNADKPSAAKPSAHKRRVCVFAPTSDGGHARYAWELTGALARHPRGEGFRFELVSSTNLAEPFRDAPYPVHAILPPIRERSSMRNGLSWVWDRLTHYPRRERYFAHWLENGRGISGVHLQEWKPWLAAAMIRRLRRGGTKVFYTVHNVIPHKYPPGVPKWLMHHWIRRSCRECDGLFVHTERLAGELAKFLGAGHPPITVVPHGVWTVGDGDATERVGMGERLKSRRLLFFGAIRRNKGLEVLLRAMPLLPGYRLTVAGEPCDSEYFNTTVLPLVRSLRESGVEVDLLDRFIPEEEVGTLFAAHSAIVLPYTKQFVAQSGVVFMALAHGVPVVASRAGGLHELLGEFPIGTTFDDDSPQAVAAAVTRLHSEEHRDELDRQIQAARRRFTWHATAGATIAAYRAAFDLMEPAAEPATEPVVRPAAELNDCALGTTPAH